MILLAVVDIPDTNSGLSLGTIAQGPASTLFASSELIREQVADDDKFLKQFLYFFELKVPPSTNPTAALGSFVFPLVIAPNSIRTSEPFMVEKTPTNNSGLYVEENGILYREITISGTLGWKPRVLPLSAGGGMPGNLVLAPPSGRSYSRTLLFNIAVALSGLRHLQYLQDACFRAYGDLVADTTTKEGTQLFWHNPKEDEHWLVHPLAFDIDRTADENNLQHYTIRLLATQGAAQAQLAVDEDASILSVIGDATRMVRNGLAAIQGGLDDIANVETQVRDAVTGIAGVLDDIGNIADALSAVVDGATAIIDIPLTFVASAQDALESVLSAYFDVLDAGSEPRRVSDAVINSLRKIGDGLAVVQCYPELYEDSLDDAVAKFNAQVDAVANGNSQQELEDAATNPAPSSYAAFDRATTFPGDLSRTQQDLGLGSKVPKFAGATSAVVEQGDTLVTLAARRMGDGRLWKFIAIFNALEAPYVSAARLPNTVRTGDTILIPTTTRVRRAQEPGTLGVSPSAPAEEASLGVDYEMVSVGKGLFDFAVDRAGGSVDFRKVRGRFCFAQGLRTRVVTERGADPLYPSVGTAPIVGLGFRAVDEEMAKIRMLESFYSDPRTVAVAGVTVGQDPQQADVFVVDANVVPRGFDQPSAISFRKGG